MISRTAPSSSSSVFGSAMDDDLEKTAALPAGEAAGESEKKLEEARDDNIAASPAINPMDPSQFPEGGLEAWTVVFGSACGIYVSFGWINCIGVFQDYYQSHQLKEYTAQEIAWIPSLEAFMMFIGGLWVGRVYGQPPSAPSTTTTS
ncbi:hypothetical protein CLCR_03725 [Cladophialophora carrionii]|uniref:Monocarboxylate transporter n=1 Tax=Cladophialophora carrionii TaxID=86049 RepID=A0A1C1CH27_9EURO|nr:hypothetical protein CLCR_03725 [Cladophialophora carrionii]